MKHSHHPSRRVVLAGATAAAASFAMPASAAVRVGIGIALPSLHFRPTGAYGVFEVCQPDPDHTEPASFVTDLHLLDTHSAGICLPLPNARIEVFQA